MYEKNVLYEPTKKPVIISVVDSEGICDKKNKIKRSIILILLLSEFLPVQVEKLKKELEESLVTKKQLVYVF